MRNRDITKSNFQLDEILIEPARHSIVGKGKRIRLEPMVMRVLCVLAERPGEVVFRNELIGQVWGVEHGANERLVRAIYLLRKALRCLGVNSSIIKTIPKSGYMLNGTVTVDDQELAQMKSTLRKWNIVDTLMKGVHNISIKNTALSKILFFTVFISVLGWGNHSSVTSTSTKQSSASIVILPLLTFTANPEDEFFTQVVETELRTAFDKVPDLEIVNSTGRDQLTINNSQFALKSSIRQIKNTARMSVQLLRMSDGAQIWSDVYQLKGSDDVEVDVASTISRAVQVRLGVGIGANHVRPNEISASAYEHYLRGISAWSGRDHPGNRRAAIASFRLATAEAPDFSDAWARYGAAIALSPAEATGLSIENATHVAEDALKRAIFIDPDNPNAHSGLSTFLLRRRLNTQQAEFHAQRALDHAPNEPEAHYAHAMSLLAQGRTYEAELAFDRAISMDPENIVLKIRKLSMFAGRGDVVGVRAVLAACDRCTDPVYAYITFVAALQSKSKVEIKQAITAYQQKTIRYMAAGGSPNDVSSLEELNDMVEIFLHKRGEALGWRSWMTDAPATIIMASAYAHIGETDLAADMLEEVVRRSAFLETFELVANGGPLAFPTTFVNSTRYRAIWSTPSMNDVAMNRYRNGRLEGLPPTSLNP